MHHISDKTSLSPLSYKREPSMAEPPDYSTIRLNYWAYPHRSSQCTHWDAMRIHYDWRLARVVDDEGNIVDELEWDGPITHTSLSKRLKIIQGGRIFQRSQPFPSVSQMQSSMKWVGIGPALARDWRFGASLPEGYFGISENGCRRLIGRFG